MAGPWCDWIAVNGWTPPSESGFCDQCEVFLPRRCDVCGYLPGEQPDAQPTDAPIEQDIPPRTESAYRSFVAAVRNGEQILLSMRRGHAALATLRIGTLVSDLGSAQRSGVFNGWQRPPSDRNECRALVIQPGTKRRFLIPAPRLCVVEGTDQ